jgi:predicted porin
VNLTRIAAAAALLSAASGAFAQQLPQISMPGPQGAPSAPPQAPPAAPGFIAIYGIADAGVQYVKPEAGTSTSGVVSGGKSGSRLGFRGTKEFADGWNAQVVLEMGYSLDTGELRQGGRTFGRQAFGAINGPYGTLAAGRIPAFSAGSGNFDLIGDIDPFLTQFGFGGVGTTMSSAAGLRLDNSIVWASPTWNGLRGGVGHSFNADGGESPGMGNNLSVTTSGLRYENAGFTGGVTYDLFHNPAGGPNETHFQALAAYDFKVAKAFAGFGVEHHLFASEFNATASTDGANAKAYMVGMTAPLGNGTFRLSYQWRDQTDSRNLRVPSIGYEYYLLKNLQLYAVFTDVNGSKALDRDPDFDHKDFTAGVYFRF